MNYSFWEKKYIQAPAEVIILGSGIVGISTAISILEARPGTTVKIIERGSWPYGASTKNAGFSCFGSVSELLDDVSHMGEDACLEIVSMRWQGLQKLKNRVGVNSLEYSSCGGTELFRPRDKELQDKCLSSLEYCNKLIKDATGLETTYSSLHNEDLKGFSDRLIYNRHEGTLNPVSMMNCLISKAADKGAHIIRGVNVTRIDSENRLLECDEDICIPYDLLVVCTNGFAAQLLPHLDVRPARNQVLMTAPIPGNRLKSGYHLDKGYVYFRNYEGRILLGGGRNLFPEEESTDKFGNTTGIREFLTNMLDIIHPGASSLIEHWWSGILGIGESKYPIIQWIDDHILAGVRMGGMGVAIGSHLGDKLAIETIEKLT